MPYLLRQIIIVAVGCYLPILAAPQLAYGEFPTNSFPVNTFPDNSFPENNQTYSPPTPNDSSSDSIYRLQSPGSAIQDVKERIDQEMFGGKNNPYDVNGNCINPGDYYYWECGGNLNPRSRQ